MGMTWMALGNALTAAPFAVATSTVSQIALAAFIYSKAGEDTVKSLLKHPYLTGIGAGICIGGYIAMIGGCWNNAIYHLGSEFEIVSQPKPRHPLPIKQPPALEIVSQSKPPQSLPVKQLTALERAFS